MATDTTETPEKKLTGAALAAPDGQAPVLRSAEFDAAREDMPARLDRIEARLDLLERR